MRWQPIKKSFSHGPEQAAQAGEGNLAEALLEACNPDGPEPGMDYIHFNPVKYGPCRQSVDELIALSKAKPGTLNHLTASRPLVVYMDRLHNQQDADWVRVPFKGGGEATNAILSGTTPIGLSAPATSSRMCARTR
jgi:Tripartite tricarboxylate transporter family receptor